MGVGVCRPPGGYFVRDKRKNSPNQHILTKYVLLLRRSEQIKFDPKTNVCIIFMYSRRSAIFKKGSWKRVPNNNQIVFMYHI